MDVPADDELTRQYARFERGRELYLINGVAPIFGLIVGLIFCVGAIYPILASSHGQFFYLGLEILGVCVALFCIGAHAAYKGKTSLAIRCVAIAACLAVITLYAFLTGNNHFTGFAAAGLATFSLVIVLVGIISDGTLIWPVTLVTAVATVGIIWLPQSDVGVNQRLPITIEVVIQQLGCALLMIIMNVAHRATIKSLGNFYFHNRNQAVRLFVQDDNLNVLTHELKKPINNLAVMMAHTPVGQLSRVEEQSLRATIDVLAQMINVFPWDEEAVRREYMLERICVGDILEHARTMVNGAEMVDGHERIQLSHNSSEDIYVWGHSVNLRLLFVNLFANALQATQANHQPSIIVHIGTPFASRDTVGQQNASAMAGEYIPERLEIQVSDNGVGIAAQDLPRLFDKYYSTSTRDQATKPLETNELEPHGIGLWACQQYVQAMKGSLHARSRGVGWGATFTVTLDVCDLPLVRG